MNPIDVDIVNKLLEVGENIGANDLVFCNDPLVGNLVKNDPFAFLMAASIDRGMVAENAWRLPGRLKAKLGHLDPDRIAEMTSDEMLILLKTIEGKPRYITAAAKSLVDVADHVQNHYDGDARSLWKNQHTNTIKKRLESIFGIGPGIASMIVILLIKLDEISPTPEEYANIDPKPDVHVQRVFQRLGFCGRNPTERDVIEAARRVHPEYPGELDGPAWRIGKDLCHSQNPTCSECPMDELCPKLV